MKEKQTDLGDFKAKKPNNQTEHCSVFMQNQPPLNRTNISTYLPPNSLPVENINLGETKREVLKLLYKGMRPNSISKELKITKSTTTQHLFELRKLGLVKKGIKDEAKFGDSWIITEKGEESNRTLFGFHAKSHWIAQNKPNKYFKPDSVRGHAFMFRLEIPRIASLKSREEKLSGLKIPFKEIKRFGGGIGLDYKGRKIHLTKKSMIIFEKESYLSETAERSKNQAINHFLRLIKGLERDLQEDFSDNGRYRFKVSRQHYSLIKNALAKQYDESGKKLEVYNEKGLWFLIDNSFNLHEAETVHPKTGVPDNKTVQDFFNGLKENPITPQEISKKFQENLELINETVDHIKKGSELQIGQMQVVHQIEQNLLHLTKIVYEIGSKK